MDQEDAAHDLYHDHVQPAGEDEGDVAHDQEAEQVAKTVRGRSYTQT